MAAEAPKVETKPAEMAKPAPSPAPIIPPAVVAKVIDIIQTAKATESPFKNEIPKETITSPEETCTDTAFVMKNKEEADAAFDAKAKEKGYIKKPTALSTDQKVVRAALVSFAIMATILFFKWINPFIVGNHFIGTWQDGMAFLETVAVLFINVVLAKIKQAYTEGQEAKANT